MSRIPGIRTVFNAADLRFLKMGNLCYRAGQIHKLQELMNGVLALHQQHTAMIYLDKKAPLFSELKKRGALGVAEHPHGNPGNDLRSLCERAASAPT